MESKKQLIDLNAAFKRLEKETWRTESTKSSIRMFLNKANRVDAIEVVRCEVCRFGDPCICVVCEDGRSVVCTKFHNHVPKNHYCSFGERLNPTLAMEKNAGGDPA